MIKELGVFEGEAELHSISPVLHQWAHEVKADNQVTISCLFRRRLKVSPLAQALYTYNLKSGQWRVLGSPHARMPTENAGAVVWIFNDVINIISLLFSPKSSFNELYSQCGVWNCIRLCTRYVLLLCKAKRCLLCMSSSNKYNEFCAHMHMRLVICNATSSKPYLGMITVASFASSY